MSEFSPELTRAIEDYELRVSPDLKTVTGRLKYCIGVIDGEMHHDFAMHLLTVREDMAIDPQLEGQERLIAAYAASLDKLGGLAAESLTPDLLLDEMTAANFDALYWAQELLQKKRLCPHPAPTVTDTPS
ncbi:MAG: hypothetical protein ACFNVM_00015 [Neisseria elongata]